MAAGNPVLTGKVVGLQNGDEIARRYSTVATAGSKVGDYAIVPARGGLRGQGPGQLHGHAGQRAA